MKNCIPKFIYGIRGLFRIDSLLPAAIFACLTLTSCFTGIEGTKKITLSRDDKKILEPTEEEIFFSHVAGTPLSKWQPGKEFVAADDKTILIFDQQGLPVDPAESHMAGDTLTFNGISTRIGPDAQPDVVLHFSCNGKNLIYDTDKNPGDADAISSDRLPMLIDLDMVSHAKELLIGKKLWIKSPLWYNDNGDRIPGLKFIAVEILDIVPGTLVFPLNVKFRDEAGKTAWAFMNFGNSGKESRSFSSIFSLSDPRKRYPTADDETWKLICQGKVKTGMTKEQCKLALGNPSDVNSGHDYSQTLDLWHYADGTVLWFEDGLLSRFRR